MLENKATTNVNRRPLLWIGIGITALMLLGGTLLTVPWHPNSVTNVNKIESSATHNPSGVKSKNDIAKFLGWLAKRKRLKKWPSSQGFPCISPRDMTLLEDAVYASRSQQYLDQHTKGKYKILSQKKFHKWRGFMVRGPNKKLYFVFRGAHKKSTQLRTMVGLINRDKKKFNKWIKGKTKDYGRRGYTVDAYIGLSAGGHFANKLWAGGEVWRLTFNGYKCRGGINKINLRSTDDWLTSKKDKNYLTIPFSKGGHAMKAFRCLLPLGRASDWRKLNPLLKQWPRCRNAAGCKIKV